MKKFSTQPHPTVQTNDSHEKFALLEVFKILMAAALCGIVFSLFAAGLTLLLMSSSEAHNLQAEKLTATAMVPARQIAQPTNTLSAGRASEQCSQSEFDPANGYHRALCCAWQCVVDSSGTVRQAAFSQNKERRVVGIAGLSPDEVDKRRRRYLYRAHFRRHCGRFMV